jgi:hypothetical protein
VITYTFWIYNTLSNIPNFVKPSIPKILIGIHIEFQFVWIYRKIIEKQVLADIYAVLVQRKMDRGLFFLDSRWCESRLYSALRAGIF